MRDVPTAGNRAVAAEPDAGVDVVTAPARRNAALVACVTALVTLAYLVPFRRYGLNFDDEGTLLYELVRVLRGDVPYVDFRTGYTPGYFYLGAGLWRMTGAVPDFRVALACVHALTAGGLAVLLAPLVRPTLAVLAPLLYVAFIPVWPAEFCAFNVPYPAWFASLGWIATAAAMAAYVRRRRALALIAAGLAAAATFGMKPNAGVFAMQAALAALLVIPMPRAASASSPRPPTWRARALWMVLWLAVLAAVPVALGGFIALPDALVYLVPIALVLTALLTRARIGRPELAREALILVGTFAAVSLPWLAYFAARLGIKGFLREVLLIGSGAAQLYYTPYPAFERWALVVTVVVAGAAVVGLLVRAGRIPIAAAGVGVAVALAAAAVAVARLGVMPERLVWSLIWQLESAAFPLTLMVHVAGAWWFWRHRSDARALVPAVLLLFAILMHLQLYPRADFMHLVGALPLTVVAGTFLLDRVLDWWQAGATNGRGKRAVVGGVAIVLSAIIVLRITPSVAALRTAPRFELPFAVAPVGVEDAHAGDFRDLAAAALALQRFVGDGGPTLGFPALDVALFLVGARNPTPYTYFYPGRPDHGEEAEIVDTLARTAPAALVTLNRRFTFFDDAPPYYFLLRRFVRARYALHTRAGRFDVVAKRDVAGAAAPHGSESETRDAAPSRDAAESNDARDIATLLGAAIADDSFVRQAAMRDLLAAVARGGRAGLESYVAAERLDRRAQILLLRTIRDTRDARAASYLFAAAGGSDPRLAREALEAMARTRAELVARRYLWAGREDATVWPARAQVAAAARGVLADPAAPDPAVAFAAVIASAVGDHDAVPALRARLEMGMPGAAVTAAAAVTTASAALALTDLAPADLGCVLLRLLARREPEIVAIVPSLVLTLVEDERTRDAATLRCLADAIVSGGAAAEDATWVAAAAALPEVAPALRTALGSPDARVRRAAAWGLGEVAHEPAVVAALASARQDDEDAATRALAATAMEKLAGRMPRAMDEGAPGKDDDR